MAAKIVVSVRGDLFKHKRLIANDPIFNLFVYAPLDYI